MAQARLEVPRLQAPVNDLAGILSSQAISKIDSLIRSAKAQSGTQITVLIVPSLEGDTIEEASIRITDQWKLGEAKTDRGVLFLIAMKDRQLRIEVGQGLEGDLPDAFAKRIIDRVVPYMRSGSYDAAILTGVLGILEKTDPKLSVTEQVDEPGPSNSSVMTIAIFILIISFSILSRIFGRHRFWGGGPRGPWGGGSSGWGGGGFSGWGSGGGGWSGGGGGFSGGGASGRW